MIVVIPSFDIVMTRAGKSWKRKGNNHYGVLAPFLEPVAASVKMKRDSLGGVNTKPIPPADEQFEVSTRAEQSDDPPYPPSPIIRRIEWAPASTIVRKARGGDNWPITWGDDDALYTAYGDARGFKPNVRRKLSMGLCRVTGDPQEFLVVNLRSPTAEGLGDGKSGVKASGMLMVDGLLYMLVRNAKNSQLAWSKDRGRTWTWSDWKFQTSFGYPTFLNFGRNYDGARDSFVYI